MVEVGFTQTSYTVSEDVGVFSVCVDVIADYASTPCAIQYDAYLAIFSQSIVAGEATVVV